MDVASPPLPLTSPESVDQGQDASTMLAQLNEMSEENLDLLLNRLLAEEGLT